ncbi:Clavaminate synthase-like protein [Earliella scabrosa]|nr:Clavaminate synthase-like protein [Earliella scabrosa]
MPGLTIVPPFPDDVPTYGLLVIDYELIKANDKDETEKLWKAATQLGFWYLKNHGVEAEVEAMFDMGKEVIGLPMEEKIKYELGDAGGSFGYKAPGVQAIDENGTRDTIEFINVSRDDALAWPQVVHRTYPSAVSAHMASTIRPFVEKAQSVNGTLLAVFNERLGLPRGALAGLHREGDHSSSLARCIRAPPHAPDEKLFIPAHTDYGTLTFLHNRTGGLQVLPPGATEWHYVKPMPGYAICNVGDALNIFSGGILRSSIHRVVPPPGPQAAFERWTVAFFTRPTMTATLRALSDASPTIARAVAESCTPERFDTGTNAEDWIMRRTAGLRYKTYKESGWKTWKGTEDTAIPADQAT